MRICMLGVFRLFSEKQEWGNPDDGKTMRRLSIFSKPLKKLIHDMFKGNKAFYYVQKTGKLLSINQKT